MKRSISIILIVTMLMSMFVITMPISATGTGSAVGDIVGSTDGSVTIITTPVTDNVTGNTENITGAGDLTAPDISATAPNGATGSTAAAGSAGADASAITGANTGAITGAGSVQGATVGAISANAATGNTVVTAGDATRAAELAAAGYIPIVQTVGADSPDGAVTFSGVKNDKNYYLAESFTLTSGDSFASGINEISNITIDGNGHTLKIDKSLFGATTNITIKNITVEASFEEYNNNWKNSVLNLWNSREQTNAENVTLKVTTNIVNSNSSQRWGALSQGASANSTTGARSTIKNVLVTGTVTIKSATTKYDILGGIVPIAHNTDFINCTNETNFIVEAGATWGGCLGGIAGTVSDSSKFENCKNTGTITVNSTPLGGSFGGIVGEVTGSSIINCENSGKISVGTSGQPSSISDVAYGIGGIAGKAWGNANADVSISNSKNSGMIDIGAVTAKSIGGIVGMSQAKELTINNCENTDAADINFVAHWKANPPIGVGGILGYQYGANADKLEITNCTNGGDITATSMKVISNAGQENSGGAMVAGIVGAVRGCKAVSLNNVINSGSVSVPFSFGTFHGTAGIMGLWGSMGGSNWMMNNPQYSDSTLSFTNVSNSGNISSVADVAGIFAATSTELNDAKSVTFNNVINSGNVTATNGGYVGGMMPTVESKPYELTFENCTNSGTVTSSGGWGQGGFVGLINAQNDKVVFKNCVNSGPVVTTSSCVNLGGIVGFASNNVSFENCKNTANLSVSVSCDHEEGFGGIVGATNGSKITFKNCLNDGTLTLNGAVTAMYVGGIVGTPDNSEVEFINCENRKAITINSGVDKLGGVGGISGYALNATTFENCSNSGAITVHGTTNGADVGGMVGDNANTLSIKNCLNSGAITIKSTVKALGSVGGMLGSANANVTIENCANSAEIKLEAGSGVAIDFLKGIGGIIGSVGSDGVNAVAKLTNCVNSGNISSLSPVRNVAGMAGAVAGSIEIDNVKNTGVITAAAGNSKNLAAGGVIGFKYHESRAVDRYVVIKNATNTGMVTVSGTGGNGVAIGGMVGAIRGAIRCELVNCINSGEINTANATGGFNEAGGMVAIYGSVGNWIHNSAYNDSYAVFERCYNNGAVTCKGYAGGIISHGYELSVFDYVNFIDCVNDVNGAVTSVGGAAGGIAAIFTGTSGNDDINFERCVNKGAISAGNEIAGGIVGKVSSAGYAKNCVNHGAVSGTAAKVDYGGVFGYANEARSFENCVNYGKVSVNNNGGDDWSGVGGIVGRTGNSDPISFYNCLNEGEIVIESSAAPVNVGGIVGRNNCVGNTFENCVNKNNITIKSAVTRLGNVGGISGDVLNGATFTNCFNEGDILFEEGIDLLWDTSIEVNEESVTVDWFGEYGVGGIVGKASGNSISFTGCQNDGAITAESAVGRSTGGILGFSAALNVTIDNCENTENGDINVISHYGTNAPIGVAGIMGYHYKSLANKIYIKNTTNAGDVNNNGSVRIEVGTKSGDGGIAMSGIIAASRGCRYITVENVINDGNIKNTGNSGWFFGTAGIMALWGSVGKANWMSDHDDSEINFIKVVNNGDVTSTSRAAGIYAGEEKEVVKAKGIFYTNVTNAGDITSTGGGWVGGIAGTIQGEPYSVSLLNCTNSGAISTNGTWTVGGLVSNVQNINGDNSASFENCLNTGVVSHVGATELGGVLGHASDSVLTFKNCKNTADLEFTATAEGSGSDWGFGGVIGMINVSSAVYEGLINTGDLSVNNLRQTNSGKGVFVGGVIGYTRNASEIKNSLNTGSISIGAVTGTEEDVEVGANIGDIGGIVGYVQGPKLTNCDNEGSITFDDGAKIRYMYSPQNQNGGGEGIVRGVAGIAGRGNAYSITDCDNSGDILSGNVVIGRTQAGIYGVSYASNLIIDNCTNTGELTFKGWHNSNPQIGAAGILGMQYQSNANSIEITNCESTGDITNTQTDGEYVRGHGGASVGGIAGSIRGIKTTLVENCVNSGNLDNSVNVTFGASCGGIVGIYGSIGNWMQGNTDPGCTFTIKDCVNNGSVSGRLGVSGILGYTTEMGDADNEATKMVFDGCVNNGDITTKSCDVGGIWSMLNVPCKVKFIDCINSADVTLTAMGNLGKIGGIAGYINANASFEGCKNYADIVTTTKGTGSEAAGLGGIAGMVQEHNTVTFTDCENEGALTLPAEATQTSIGGILGFSTRAVITIINSNNSGDITVSPDSCSHMFGAGGILGFAYSPYVTSGDEITILGCKNSGDVTLDSGVNCAQGGIVGSLRCTSYVLIDGAENSGNVTSTRTTSGYGTFSGGIVGSYGTLGNNWAAVPSAELNIRNTVNYGNVNGFASSGGILANTMEISGEDITINIDGCANLGEVIAKQGNAGGIMGAFDGSQEGATVNISHCLNAGAVNAGLDGAEANTGGIFGACGSKATIVIDSCVNYGSVTSNGWNAAGIYGWTNGDGYATKFVKNCVNMGKITGSPANKAQAIGWANLENCYADVNACGNNIYNATGVYTLEALEKAAETNVNVYYKEHLALKIQEIEEFLDGLLESKYDSFTLDDLKNALADAKEAYALADVEYVEVDGIKMPDYLKQYETHAAYKMLVKAREDLLFADEKIVLLDRTIAEAEELYASDEIYTVSSWKGLTDALKAAKELRTKEDLAERDTDEIVTAIANIRSAMDALVLGGDIRTEADFALLNGQKGTFELMNDITVSAPVESFAGVLNGNGYTITVNGCALFNELDGATVNGLNVEGTAGDAASLLGKAVGDVTVSDMLIKVDAFAEAALFDSAEDTAHIDIRNVVSYASTGVAAVIGNVNCRVAMDLVVVMGNAEALMGSVASGSVVTFAYVKGVEYYDGDGDRTTDAAVFASGKIAYEINEKIGEIVLVQILGDDAYPVIGAAMPDGLNVVVKDGDIYRNAGYKYDGGVGDLPEIPDVNAPVAPVYNGLQAIIENADTFKKDSYTDESWAAFQTALKAAKAALEAETQAEVDAAGLALTVAITELVRKSEVETGEAVDYTKLDEAIAQADSLTASDYTEGTWATLQAMRAKAKAAKRSTDQTVIDAARVALESAITNLKKAPVETDAPKDETPKPTEPADEEGCGSVVGGAAVVLAAVIALGAGVSFKKKED